VAYHPIENYGIVGDLHTVALVAENASIDFMCFPIRCGTSNSTSQTRTYWYLVSFPSKELPK
jgi:hypothetical protein